MGNGRRDPRFLRSLQYFEAVARHGSMLVASRELGVSPSAVSHQLRDLRRMVGEELVVRKGRGVQLTNAGRILAAKLVHTFDALDATVNELIGTDRTMLRVGVCSAFGPFWLAPRLAAFRAMHPHIEIELRLYSHDPEQTQATADCIVTARPVKPGFVSTDLMVEHLVAVASPQIAATLGNDAIPLITTDTEPGLEYEDWTDFVRLAGLDREITAGASWVRCTHYLLAVALARSAMGIALVPDFLASDDLRDGRLRQHFPQAIPSGRTYRLCVKEARTSETAIRLLVGWLRRESMAAGTGK